jgi:uncharacterized protein (TIGR02271 family)
MAAVMLPQQEGRVAVPVPRSALGPPSHAVQEKPLDAVGFMVAAALELPTRVVETGTVRLTTGVHARETLVDALRWHDSATITCVPMSRVVAGPVPVREDNGTTMIAVAEEVLVVEKHWMLREEIHIRKQRIETHQPQRITLRSEDVQIERVPHADEHT